MTQYNSMQEEASDDSATPSSAENSHQSNEDVSTKYRRIVFSNGEEMYFSEDLWKLLFNNCEDCAALANNRTSIPIEQPTEPKKCKPWVNNCVLILSFILCLPMLYVLVCAVQFFIARSGENSVLEDTTNSSGLASLSTESYNNNHSTEFPEWINLT